MLPPNGDQFNDQNPADADAAGETRLAAALDYARRGWRVIPLHHVTGGRCSCGDPDCVRQAGKHPRTDHGSKDGTTDERQVRRWWRGVWASSNVAVCTGPESDVWVVGPDGQAGLDALSELEREHHPLPLTPRQRTGGGGRHFALKWPADGGTVKNARNHRGLPIDVRGAGGYFVAAPSVNRDGPYAWEVPPEACEPADTPDWLLEWARDDGKPRYTVPPPRGERAGGADAHARAVAYVAKCEPAVSGQGGHDRTFAVACAVVQGFDLGAAAGFDVLWEHYNPRCVPPWSERELRHKVADADAKPGDRPRGWLLSEDRGPPRPGGPADANGHAASSPASAGPQTAAQIILRFFRTHYRPAFRRGNAVVCRGGETVPQSVACFVPTSALIDDLAAASDAPRYAGQDDRPGGVKRSALPKLFASWSKVAWGDLLAELPEEDAEELGCVDPAAEEFRRLVCEALLSEVVLGTVIRSTRQEGEVTQTERRSLAEWCLRFAKPGPWRSVRSKRCWCRMREVEGGELVLEVAIRHELFSQLRADPRLRGLGPMRFVRLAAKYGVGTSTRAERPHGLSAVVLAEDLVRELTAGLADDGEGDGTGAGDG
jgi:hypothetical protein